MTVIFGFLNKNKQIEINDEFFADIRDDLSLGGIRGVNSVKFNNNAVFYQTYALGEQQKDIATNENGSLLLLLGGRVFDYKQKISGLLKQGHILKYRDNAAEILLHSFEEFGQAAFKNLNGLFTIAVWDKTNGRLILANDTFGLRSLFIYDSEEAFIFCSEYQPILKYRDFKNSLNHDAIAEYFLGGSVLGNKTFFSHIHNLPPASVLEIKNNKLKIEQYETFDIEMQRDKPIKFFAQKIDEIFRHAVRIRIDDSGINHADLSGGLDTRFTLGSMSPSDLQQMEFDTFLRPYLAEDMDKDIICAKMLAKKFNFKHNVVKEPEQRAFGPSYFDDIRYANVKNISKFIGTCGGEFLGGVYLKIYQSFIYPYERLRYLNNDLALYFSKNFIKKLGELADLRSYSQMNKDGVTNINKPLLFSYGLCTRLFFTSLYGGARSGALCPFQLYLSPFAFAFIDTELLKALLTVPPEYLENANLYLEIIKNYHSGLLEIPFASSTIRKPDSGLKQLETGEYYFMAKKPIYDEFLPVWLRKSTRWEKNDYNWSTYYRRKIKTSIRYYLKKEISFYDMGLVKLLDFGAWLRRYYTNPKNFKSDPIKQAS